MRMPFKVPRNAFFAPIASALLVAAPGHEAMAFEDPDFVRGAPTPSALPEAQKSQLMVVNVPELNVFPEPNVNAGLIGALHSGDGVTVERWQTDSQGEKWARVCTRRYCGWVGADFIEPAPADEP
ncbi:MAG: SH3 domain-containing protein [Hyphomicrobium sp.]|uniref:SH3 domain-containing protein n=1 Tax=Hyphomicrobium sp. TaxID=82 RepID=UPI0013218C14|nr:SH3 domain-containing protein [Hyphomicrobium sp.]KAB2941741.1 MAG: SH3 domain-containing protein [Hyphomicrobium sp.]MBZ0210022.1 SH3 domain-containing protein [Hyphomicrobium sp.]